MIRCNICDAEYENEASLELLYKDKDGNNQGSSISEYPYKGCKGCESDAYLMFIDFKAIKEERNTIAIENKYLARHLLQNNYTQNEVDSIAKGFDDWREEELENIRKGT